MKKLLCWLAQLGLLTGIYYGSLWIVRILDLPIPANVLGILILFGLLCTGIINISHIQEISEFLLRHLIFFFIPITVGLMDWGDIFRQHGILLICAILSSSILALLSVGATVEALTRKRK